MKCNVCGSPDFVSARKSDHITVCKSCGSLERTRMLMLYLQKYDLPKPGMRVMHFAPEIGLARYIHDRIGSSTYETYDIVPANYSFDFHTAERFDMCQDLETVKDRRYDLIIHNHVLEHLPCNYSMVLLKLQALLTKDGHQAFSIPIRSGFDSSCDLGRLSREERLERFGQSGHVRNFGRRDFFKTVGMIFDLKEHDALNDFTEEQLKEVNIGKPRWKLSSASVFFMKRDAAAVPLGEVA